MKKITLLLALFLVLVTWNVNAQITTYPYFEDFESGDGGWTVDGTGSWELGTPANAIINSADTGTNAWVTNLTGGYGASEDTSVVSPVFDLSSLSAPSIEFSIWWNSEFSWDGMVLQSSIDAGASWQNVGDFADPNNWFNDDTIGADPGGQAIGWTGREAVSNNGSNGWVTARHALVGLAGQSSVLLRFAFASDTTVQDEGVAFDSINIFEVSCPEPSGITIANIIATTADVSWTPGGGETNWEIVVQTAGTGAPTGSGTSTAANNPYNVSGLTAVTDYEVYVRSDCSGEFSSWVGPTVFQTGCSVFIPDYNANMSVNVPDACWDESNDGEIADGPSGSGTSDWRDGTDYALGDSNAINLFGNTDREWLISPIFDLSADGYQLEVNVAVTNWLDGFTDDTMGSDDEVKLLQSIDGGTTWTTLTTWNAANEPAVGGTEYIQDLTGVTGASVQFAIWASDGTVNDTEDYDFHVGKFRVRTPPTCPEPINLALDTFSDVDAVISWDLGGSETSWEVVVQAAGTGEPTSSGVATTDNPYTATGLTATTDYEIWVRGDCGAQGLSSWVGPITFTTFNMPPPPPVGVTCSSGSSSFIFTAEFDGLDGWTGDLNGGDGSWEVPNDSGSGDTGADVAFSGASFMNYEASGGTTATASAVSPAIDLTTAVDGAELSFYMHAFGVAMGTLNVGISNSATGPFTNEYAWAGEFQTDGAQPWVPIGINLDAYLGQVIYIEFSHTGTGDFEGDMSIDLVRVETCGTFCIAPSSILTSGTTQTTVDIDWTANSGETAWEYVVVPAGTGEPTGPGNAVASTSITETGLTGTTEYEVWVRADCGGGTYSLWAGPIPFFTAPENNDPCSATTAVVNIDQSCDLTTFGTIYQASSSGVPSGACAGDPDDDVWFEFVAENESQLISLININGGTTNLDHGVYEGNCGNLTELFCSDIEFSFDEVAYVVGNTYYIRVFSGGSIPETSTFDLCIRSAPINTICEEAENPCIGTGDTGAYFFPSVVGLEPGPEPNDVACLGSAPNPSWFQFEVGDDGIIQFEIAQYESFDDMGNPVGDDLDVDFVLWGPFDSTTDYCNLVPSLETDCPTCPFSNITTTDFYPFDNIVDCSFDGAAIENFTIDNAMAGEIYVLLVTNWSRDPGFIRIEQTNTGGGFFTAEIDGEIGYTGSSFDDTDGDTLGDYIVVCDDLSINPSITLTAISAFADTQQWYKNGFEIVGETSSTLVVTESNTYQVIVYDEGCDSNAQSQIVEVHFYNESTANPVDDIETCDDASADGFEDFDLSIRTAQVLGTQDPSNFTVTYYASVNDAWQAINPLPLNYTNTIPNLQTIYIRVEDNAAAADGYLQCAAVTQFDLVVGGALPTANLDTYPECDDDQDGIAGFDLPSRDANILGAQSAVDFTVSYYTSQQGADDGIGSVDQIDTSTLYNSPTATIYVRVESNLTFDCYATNTMSLVVNPSPDSTFVLTDLTYCDIAPADGFEDFDLESQTATVLGTQTPSDFNVTYHTDFGEAQAGTNAIDTSTFYNSPTGTTIYVRIENATATECFVVSSFNLMISGPTPTVNSVTYTECADDLDGTASFDLASQNGNVLGGQDATIFNVTYHETEDNAIDNVSAIDTASFYVNASTTIYVRIESNIATNCYETGEMMLVANPLPDTTFTTNFDYEVCPGGNSPILITATANNYAESEVTISWKYEGGIITGENSLTLSVVDAGLYEIIVVNNLTGCEWSKEQMVIELPTCVIPQGISPNGDEFNQDFDLSSYNVSKLEIFNRNGVLVYSKKNYTNEWHGQTDGGDELPVGTYFYTMEYENGKQRAAWVYIQREN